MKIFQLALLVIGSFGAGFLLADGLAKSAPEVVFVQSEPTVVTKSAKTVNCDIATIQVPVLDTQPKVTKGGVATLQSASADGSDIAMPLASYSAMVASQQRPATELILQIDDADFVQMLEQQQQDQQFDAQSDGYQQQLSEFIHSYPDVVQAQSLTCSSKFCLLEVEVQNFAAWPTFFKTLTAQHWWQSISYQSALENAANHEQQSNRITLLLQQDWMPVAEQQQWALADGGQFDR